MRKPWRSRQTKPDDMEGLCIQIFALERSAKADTVSLLSTDQHVGLADETRRLNQRGYDQECEGWAVLYSAT